ncbi:C1 family peptidase [Candidatus Parabeggiatoa sp. HSG14]|uniref:C1 family peptidase n=1 Tax=Candidatus Parabeggiatoa sp. HSG14 TaxID=3055593 RepID=UPI0025A7E9C8|nr:C1 family peptidase [Thiotrichales bacterium HSG14]
MKFSNFTKNKYITRYTSLTAMLCISLGITSPTQAEDCQPSYSLWDATLHLPCLDWLSDPASRTVYQADLILEDADTFLYRWGTKTLLDNPSSQIGAIFNVTNNSLYIPTLSVQTAPGITQPYEVTFQASAEGVLSVTLAKPLLTQDNTRPTATSFSVSLSPDDLTQKSYQAIQLTGTDDDNDTLAFELLAASSDTGYTVAYIDPISQTLYVVIEDKFFGTIELPYRVTDGKIFSTPATVKLTVENVAADSSLKLGSQRIGAREFAGFNMKKSDKRSSPESGSTESTLPTRVDLSSKFPTPRDQGEQSSCVGWSAAYVKSYHEALEMGWPLNQDEQIFSPAFIYNNINGKSDYGAKISDGLDILVKKGAATLSTMPYDATFGAYLKQPSDAAKAEAKNYKADAWGVLKTSDDVKTALANRQPAIVSMAVYDTFKNLKGENSIYNTSGTYLGDHAVAIVGYDDEYAGGAFKIINSWGTEWGDKGFFWVPFDFLSTAVEINGEEVGTLFNGAYMLLDKKNGKAVSYEAPSASIVGKEEMANLPNLTVMDWQAEYDPQRWGQGQIQYKVANTGTAVLSANKTVWVDVILTDEATVSAEDYAAGEFYYLVSEEISTQLASGEAAIRDASNPLPFSFGGEIPEGTYYLHLIVAGMDNQSGDFLEELNMDDNVKSSETTITLLPSDLPNLATAFWYAEWHPREKLGWLTYSIVNDTDTEVEADIDWEIKLVLWKNDSEYTIWRETVTDTFLPAGENFDPEEQDYPFSLPEENEQGFFDIRYDVDGNQIPSDRYELVFKLDGGDKGFESGTSKVKESDEYDNTSHSGIFVGVKPPLSGQKPSYLPGTGEKTRPGGEQPAPPPSDTETPVSPTTPEPPIVTEPAPTTPEPPVVNEPSPTTQELPVVNEPPPTTQEPPVVNEPLPEEGTQPPEEGEPLPPEEGIQPAPDGGETTQPAEPKGEITTQPAEPTGETTTQPAESKGEITTEPAESKDEITTQPAPTGETTQPAPRQGMRISDDVIKAYNYMPRLMTRKNRERMGNRSATQPECVFAKTIRSKTQEITPIDMMTHLPVVEGGCGSQ